MNKKVAIGLTSATLLLGICASASLNAIGQRGIKESLAYDANTKWYVTGEFNDWNKEDAKALLHHTSTSGNDDFFDSTYAIKLKSGDKLNFVNPYYDQGVYKWNTVGSDIALQTNGTDFTHPDGKDYIVANADMTVTFTLQKYNGGDWAGISWYKVSDEAYDADKNKCLESWCYDFVKATDSVCGDGNSADSDRSVELSLIWDNSIVSEEKAGYYVSGTCNSWTVNSETERMHKTTIEGVYEIAGVQFGDASNERFKITDGTWDHSWPGDDYGIGSKGTYTIIFDTRNGANTVKAIREDRLLKNSYNDLSNNARAYFASGNDTAKIHEAYLRYVHIINRYANLDNFASATVSRGNVASNTSFEAGSQSNLSYAVVAISGIALLGFGAFFFLHKKKEQ